MMFTKFFMLNDSAIINPFNSDYFFWVDGGLTNTVNKGYFSHDNVLDNLENYVRFNNNKFIYIFIVLQVFTLNLSVFITL